MKSLVTQINANFVIRYIFDGEKKDNLKGAGKFADLLEKAREHRRDVNAITERYFTKALNCPDDRLVIRLRGGLTITFKRK